MFLNRCRLLSQVVRLKSEGISHSFKAEGMLPSKPPYLEIEPSIDKYVVSFGGELIRDLLPKSPHFDNADYLFRKYKVVAELKTLEKDFFVEADYKQKINDLYADWQARALVPRLWGKMEIQTQNLPMECQLEFLNMVKKPLGRICKKANKQIKQTKAKLGLDDNRGVLILVNDGNYSLESAAIMSLIGRIVNTENTSIDSIIYFTVNMRAGNPNIDRDLLIWIDAKRPGSKGAPRQFLSDFRDGWLKFLELETREIIPVIDIENHSELENVTFIREKLK